MTNELARVLDQAFGLPSLLDTTFPSKVLKDVNSWDTFYTTDVFPYDIRVTKDPEGNVEKTELIFAVAGVEKENINVKVEHEWLIVNIEQPKVLDDENIEYVRRGLSHRSMTKKFYLRDADKQNIKSKLKNGLLVITIPPEPHIGKKIYSVKVD